MNQAARPVPTRILLRRLETDPRFGPNIVTVRHAPARDARLAEWPRDLSSPLVEAAAGLGMPLPYAHQAEAVAAALDGRDVVVATGTASGKSLCYVMPVLEAILRSRDARALLLFPTKALARDQLAALGLWGAELPGEDVSAATYDGDTPSGARASIRRAARIVLTNPDMLHAGILPRHAHWAELFRGLTHVVVDEAHVYRGVFGSHVANVLRRLCRIAAFHGSRPRFVLTSATIRNPVELARQLIGRSVQLVDDDGSPGGARTFVLYNPPIVDERLGIRRSALLEAEAIARHFVTGDVQTIVFAQTRQSAELMVRYIEDGLGRRAADAGPGVRVRGYRGGYTATERRAIEAELRDGRLRCVVATNALELGIDVGRLDACVIAGYPGTIASVRQQAGRAGRRTIDAAVVMVAGSSPLDQYIVRHPDYLLAGSPERARIDADNLLVQLEHVRCAAFELPFADPEAALPFGAAPTGSLEPGRAPPSTETRSASSAPRAEPYPVRDLLDALQVRGDVRRTSGTWYWIGGSDPAAGVGLRRTGADVVTVVAAAPVGAGPDDGRKGGADVLGTVERYAAPSTVHPGAVYLHDGRAFEVVDLDWDLGRATVRPADGATYTRASTRTDVRPTAVAAERKAPGATVVHGELEVRSKVTGYRHIRFRTHETIGWGDVDLPEQHHVAGGYWFTLDDVAVEALRDIGQWHHVPAADRGPSWPAQRERALARDEHRCRLCGAPARDGRSHDVHHVRPFRDFGWMDGGNRNDLQANALDNLVTLCRGCHGIAERALGLQSALGGVGYAMRHMAPLFLMCDSRDIEVSAEAHAPWTGCPTVAVYERATGGVGFGPVLFDVHESVIGACRDLVDACACRTGCPSCVGPVDEEGPNAKERALAVLAVLGASGRRDRSPTRSVPGSSTDML